MTIHFPNGAQAFSGMTLIIYDPNYMGMTILHEISHFLFLNHFQSNN
jgi:hypothetical protein